MRSVEILSMAAVGIEDRAQHRDTNAGEKSMQRNVAVFNALTGNSLTETDGWLFLSCTKLARAVQGDFHEDDYVDLAGYVALAGESAGADSVAPGMSFSDVLKVVSCGAWGVRLAWKGLTLFMLETVDDLIVVRANYDPSTDRSPSDADLSAHDWLVKW